MKLNPIVKKQTHLENTTKPTLHTLQKFFDALAALQAFKIIAEH